MKKHSQIIIFAAMAIVLLSQTVYSQNKKTGKNIYKGSAEPGDIVQYTIDEANKMYSAINYSVGGQETKGSFFTWNKKKNISDIFTMEQNDYFYYAVELTDKFLATNFPAATSKVSISASISSEIDNIRDFAKFNGEYVFFGINSDGNNNMEWGLAYFENGNWWLNNYQTKDVLPDAVDENSLTKSQKTGTYSINPADKTSFIMNSPDGEKLSGFGYASNDEAVIVIDMGDGHGFIQAIKIPDKQVDLKSLEGTYYFIDSDVDFGSGAGAISIDDDGFMDGFITDEKGDIFEWGNPQQLQQGNIPNVFFTKEDSDESTNIFYLVICGDFMMYFTLEDDDRGIISYGIGGRVNDDEDDEE